MYSTFIGRNPAKFVVDNTFNSHKISWYDYFHMTTDVSKEAIEEMGGLLASIVLYCLKKKEAWRGAE